MSMAEPKILIIYTGGTIGMIRDEAKGTLKPFSLARVVKSMPSILKLGIELHAMEYLKETSKARKSNLVFFALLSLQFQGLSQKR